MWLQIVALLLVSGYFPATHSQAPSEDAAMDLDGLSNATNAADSYSEWSQWSRCIDCLQRRMKTCIHISCHNSRMYEERECQKKRCKRKRKKLISFHVLHLNTSSSYLKKQAPSEIWSRWTKWSECSPDCRTYRVRRCKKPGRCKKQVQTQAAYCYHERTRCEEWVLGQVEAKQRRNSLDSRKYQYTYHNNQYITRESKTRADKCGVTFSKPQMLRIIGGTEAEKFKWPWHVAILNQFNEVFCGGTLIASRWVLTASHCIRKQLRVRLNAHDLRSRHGDDIEMGVYKMFAHPRFEMKTVDNDIALLMLPRQVRVPVACLPNKKPKAGQICSVMGWGKVQTTDLYGVPVLHEAKLPLVTHKTCKRAYKEFLISGNMMCAGWKSGKADTCAGDSGGGLMCPNQKPSKLVYRVLYVAACKALLVLGTAVAARTSLESTQPSTTTTAGFAT
ncbi:coagulation factor X isoform X2 [Dendroctonus ponderosae]|uniref:coagulation factor X isoform X2 n=1 Tax=Dendroctonus ponderosae TaxID=77166 RepID=UPI002035DF19|nr:coagulation factor X isoform X2 [Dendroctonus ponderosae]